MANLVKYHELLEKTVHFIGESEENYKAFLRTSSWNFKYSLPERILIFAQKPNAIACAEASVWESPKLMRTLKKDSLGIAILKDDEISYLYDVGDTISVAAQNQSFSLWEYRNDFEEEVVSLLKQIESDALKDKGEIKECIRILVEEKLQHVEEYYLAELFNLEDIPENNQGEFSSRVHDFITSSVIYMIYERMGLQRSSEIQFSDKDSLFSSDEGFLIALAITQAASEDLLRELGAVVKKIVPLPEQEKIKREDYYGYHKLQEIGPDIRARLTDGSEDELWEVRADETELPEGKQTGQVHVLSDERDTEPASGGNRRESEEIRGTAGEGITEELSSTIPGQSSGVDRTHERIEANGGRSDVSYSDLLLKKIRVPDDIVDYFLMYEHPNFKHTNEEIEAILLDKTIDTDTKIAFLVDTYNGTYYAIPHPYDTESGLASISGWPDGLYMSVGNIERTTADTNMPWAEVLQRRIELINKEKEESLDSAQEVGQIIDPQVNDAYYSGFLFYETTNQRLSKEEVDFILSSDQFLSHSNEEISAVLLDDTADFDAKKEYLISAYDEYFCSLVYPYDEKIEYVGYHKQEDGLYMWEGNFLSKTADILISWDDVLHHRMNKLEIVDKNLMDSVEDGFSAIHYPIEIEEPESYIDEHGKVRMREDILLREIRRGSGIEDGKYRIYQFFKEEHTDKEKIDFLKAEYGMGGHTIFEGAYTGAWHDSKGITFNGYSEVVKESVYTWFEVSKLIAKEVEAGSYLTEKEKSHLPYYENEKFISFLGREVTSHFKTYFPDDPDALETAVPTLKYFNSESNALVNMFSTFVGKQLLIDSLKNFSSGNVAEQKAREQLIDVLELAWNINSPKTPLWTKLDWELKRQAEKNPTLILNLKEDDVVYIGSKRFVVYEVTENGFILQDEEFPLFLKDYSSDRLVEILRENSNNQAFFENGEQLEAGHSVSHRVYRLIDHFLPITLDKNSFYVCFSMPNNIAFSFRFIDEETLLFSMLDTKAEKVLVSFNITLDEETKSIIPEIISDETLDAVYSVEKRKQQLVHVLYNLTSGLGNNKRKLLERKEAFEWENSNIISDNKVAEIFAASNTVDIKETSVPLEETNTENQNEESFIPKTKNTKEAIDDTKDEHSEDIVVVDEPNAPVPLNPVQFHIKQEVFVFGGPKERFRGNIEAIKVLKKIEAEQRFATAEEQEVLFRYVGWGGLSDAFDARIPAWKKEYEELKSLLTEEEYESAQESTLTAYYTPPVIIKGIYQALANMGFDNGNILDPACGTGNFFGMLPENMNGSNLYGVELDSVSGRIAKQLYQNSSIEIKGFEKTELPDQFFDVIVGNVPFGSFGVLDNAYKKHNFMIHDYFFAKALDKVRPGGIVAFVTSSGTMDKKNSEVREYIAKRADLLGAIRLPNNTFTKNAGTSVTSDILFLQKRDRIRTEFPSYSWVNVGENEDGFTLNQYFIDHPEMVLGKLSMETREAGRLSLECLPDDEIQFEERFRSAIDEIYGEYKPFDFDMEEMAGQKDTSIPADISVQNFGYTLIDDTVYQRRDSRMYPVEANATALRRIKGLIPLRDTLRKLIHVQLDNGSDAQVKAYQKQLNELYDAFVEEFGLINSRGNSIAFSDDSSYYLLCSLEKLDEDEQFVGKADIFTKRTVRIKEHIKQAENSMDALALCIGELGRVDLDYMESLLPESSKEEIISDLTGVIFRNPLDEEQFLTADEYLSGNVKEKLLVAKEKANEEPSFRVNVEALLTVQPKPLDATEISVRLGTTWIPDDIITEFYWDLFEVNESHRNPDAWGYNHVVYTPASDSWTVEGSDWDISRVLSTSTYGTSRRNGMKIFEDVLNLRESKVMDTYEEDGKKKTVINKEETILAQEKQERIKEAFLDWIWKDMDRRERLVSIYNEKFNSLRPREYNGDYLLFHGMNPEISLRKHQLDAVARGIYGGNTLLDHPVGAGKTWEMTAIAMEGKRLGLCNKSLFVVPNHLLKQWASDFLTLYPAANILVATEKDFTPENRKKFCARIATGDFDAVIIGHSQFEKIPLSEERQEKNLKDQISEISFEIDRLSAEKNNHLSIKQLERTKKSLQKNLDKFHDRVRRDDVITFEELGVDRLFIDEFHFYKNLWFYTKMQNIAGISPTGAQKTSDLFMKVQYLNEITDYKGLVGATGTPITNSMAELYSLQRYFTPQVLERLGISSFDAWASTFGEVTTSIELAPEGTNYRTKQRFSKFYNLPELMMLYHDFADVKTPDMLNLPVPEAVFENVCVKASNEQLDILKQLSKRADAVRDGLVEPTEDNMLKITNDGRKLALEQRLLNLDLPDNPDSKVNACIDEIFNTWEETKENKLTQLVFCDLSTPQGKKKETIVMEEKDGKLSMSGFETPFDSVYEDMKRKLVAKGIPENEIAFIHDANTTKQKEKLFANVRSGKVRILMGSTSKMGVGTNVQDKVIALHDLDCPWRPSDLEQRLGRGIRQGNQNKKVNVKRYITENTFDAYLYQLVEQKQRFISQIRNGSVNVRCADDIDESTLAFAEIKALAAGNPLIKEKMDLDVQVHKLNLLKTEYQRNQYILEENVAKHYPAKIAECNIKIQNIKKDMEVFDKYREQPFSITLKGVTYTDSKDAGKALENILENINPYEMVSIGSYAGFELFDYYSELKQKHVLYVNGKENHSLFAYKAGTRNIEEVQHLLRTLPEQLNSLEKMLNRTKADLVNAELELEKEFAYADELKIKNQRLVELNILLNVEGGAGKEDVLKNAKDINTPPELLSKLREHTSPEVREEVAANISTDVSDLLILKDDPEPAVQIAAYLNPNMPETEVYDFCKNADEQQLSSILDGPHVTERLISIILERVEAGSNLSYKIARHKKATPEILDTMAQWGNKYLNDTIIERKDLYPTTVETIAKNCEDDWYHSRSVANHSVCSEERMLLYCENSLLQEELLKNPSITDKVLERLSEVGRWSVKDKAKEMLFERQKQKKLEEKSKSDTSLDEKLLNARVKNEVKNVKLQKNEKTFDNLR